MVAPASMPATASSKLALEWPKTTTMPSLTASRINSLEPFLSGAIEIFFSIPLEASSHLLNSLISGSIMYLGFSAPACSSVKNGPSKWIPWIFAPSSCPWWSANILQILVKVSLAAVIVVGIHEVTPALSKPLEILLIPCQSLFITSSRNEPWMCVSTNPGATHLPA